MLDEKEKDLDNLSSSSDDEIQNSSDGEDTDNNEEEVVLKKSELTALKKELKSIKIALREERGEKRTSDLSLKKKKVVEEEENDEVSLPKWRIKEIEQERVEHETNEKKKILKRFPSLAANNDYGINEEIIEAYNDLLQGKIRRGRYPRTKEEVAALLEKAVKLIKPDLFIEELKEGEKNEYNGLERGESKYENAPSPKLSEMDKRFKEHVESITKK